MKRSKRTLLTVALLVFIGISLQVTSPAIPNPPVTGKFKGPAPVTALFERACYDCHSNETNLRWYDRVAPASWLVAQDVRDARAGLNFSTWDSLSPADQQNKIYEIVNMLDAGRMPLQSYTLVHPSAKVTPREIEALRSYAISLAQAKPADAAKIHAADLEFEQYKEHATQRPQTPVALNGIAYFDDYKNWKPISTTTRFDSGTMRVIYGNDIAVKAIEKDQIRPWPQGSVIVKVVWDQLEEASGEVRTGRFNNVQIMIKDDQRFPDTEGWGFARFNGLGLKPYGQSLAFQTTCFNCHKLADKNGYVFDIPLRKADLH
ncbi:heme-binding domain-containing protein [Siphonobacter curvatus]|uniref:Haem-binding domain-containing protein n=1 Tax=Siphonobacter curvatus TaxID=2094562 RepID=A0A2S7IGB5_9BACT|nr:heme-binding domain-containing protein [Siphonobacter curvatus]PQA54467.1 hypothetical protein C5O19_22220 [Siphonobacter curvatus]